MPQSDFAQMVSRFTVAPKIDAKHAAEPPMAVSEANWDNTRPEPPQPESKPPKSSECRPHGFPNNAEIIVADRDSHIGERMRSAPYMWTWVGAETWFYVSDYPVPSFGK